MKKLITTLFILLSGCATPHNLEQEMNKVQSVSMPMVDEKALLLERHYWNHAQHEGIIWPPRRSNESLVNPDMYKSGGDSALYTGYALAYSVLKYKTTHKAEDYDKMLKTLRGVYILTHVTGKPGVIARCAFNLEDKEKFNYPSNSWDKRKPFVGLSKQATTNSWITSHKEMVYYTRATRDQLTGLLFGLIIAWNKLEDQTAKNFIKTVTHNIYHHLKNNDFKIVDENGKNDTSANDVDGLLKLQLLALYAQTSNDENAKKEYEKEFDKSFCLNRITEAFNLFNNYGQYFAWNLRYARAFSIWLIEKDDDRKAIISKYVKTRLWAYTYNHNCPFFGFIHKTMDDKANVADSLFGLKSLTLKPIRQYSSPLCGNVKKPNILQIINNDFGKYIVPPHLRKPTNYSTWEKEPWDVNDNCHDGLPLDDSTGIDFLLPYWIGKHYGFVN